MYGILLVGGSTPLKNISQWEGLSHIWWKIKNVPNHQPDYIYLHLGDFLWQMLVNKSIDGAYGLGCTISMIRTSTLKIMSYHVVSFLKLVFQLSRVYVHWGDINPIKKYPLLSMAGVRKVYIHRNTSRFIGGDSMGYFWPKIMPWSVSVRFGEQKVPKITMPTIEMMIFCDLGIPTNELISDQLILVSFDLGVENIRATTRNEHGE